MAEHQNLASASDFVDEFSLKSNKESFTLETIMLNMTLIILDLHIHYTKLSRL